MNEALIKYYFLLSWWLLFSWDEIWNGLLSIFGIYVGFMSFHNFVLNLNISVWYLRRHCRVMWMGYGMSDFKPKIWLSRNRLTVLLQNDYINSYINIVLGLLTEAISRRYYNFRALWIWRTFFSKELFVRNE